MLNDMNAVFIIGLMLGFAIGVFIGAAVEHRAHVKGTDSETQL